MKIIVIPETDVEKAKFTMSEHEGVENFFVFGNKTDPENENRLKDFHDWSGSYRYLQGSLIWYTDLVKDAKRSETRRAEEMRQFGPSPANPMVQPPMEPMAQPMVQPMQPVIEPVSPIIQEPPVDGTDGPQIVN